MDEINRRSLIAGLGATGLVLGLGRKAAFADEHAARDGHQDDFTPLERECIKACTDCHNECLTAIQHCLNLGGDHVKAKHLRLLQTCAELCAVTANFMLSHSELDKELCALCAELCKRCAESCSQFQGDDAMEHCATVCRKCADVCKRFVEA